MNNRIHGLWLVVAAVCLSAPFCVQAQAPGEDPIVLNKKVSVQMLPMNQTRTTNTISYENGLPAWQQAKITRFVAKAYSGDTAGISTEKDVINSVQTKGGRTECTQSLASNTAAAGAKGGVQQKGDQIVVLRGDLVNVCF